MNRFLCLILLLALLIMPLGCAFTEANYQKFQTNYVGLFDTAILVTGYAKNQAEFNRYADIFYSRMETLHRLYDIYNEYEGINNLYTVNENAGIKAVAVEREIIDMLLLAREWHELSSGTVNIVLGPVLRIWSACRLEGKQLPDFSELEEAARITDIGDLIIDETAGTVFLLKPGMSLDVGSVAKAYAAQLALNAMKDAGMRSALINAGGNIVTFGRPLDGMREHFSIGIQNPDISESNGNEIVDTVFLTNLSVSCSGGYWRYYIVDGISYHHIIDPATLMPADYYKQVTVIHENAGLADLLSTVLFILPYGEGVILAEKCGAEVLWIDKDGLWQATDGYKAISNKY